MASRKVNKEMIKEFNELYDAGHDLRYIADKYKLVKSTVSLYIWKSRKQGRIAIVTDEIGEKITYMKNLRIRVDDIAHIVEVDSRLVYKYLRG